MYKKIICLTPVKNEEWILELFLKSASLWADIIIIADQNSTDQSKQIVKKFPKALWVKNDHAFFDERYRQKLLINQARKLFGKNILVTLDADELLTPNFNSTEWQEIKKAPEGCLFYLDMYNLQPGFKKIWQFTKKFPLVFIDNGDRHQGEQIHGPRLPIRNQAVSQNLKDIAVIHYQYVDPKRNDSKLRWYQCWEKINRPERHPIEIFRQYHHHLNQSNKIIDLPNQWLRDYRLRGVDLTKIKYLNVYWWDQQVNGWLVQYGTEKFKYLDIWNINPKYRLNLNRQQKILFKYLRGSQKYFPEFFIPRIDNFLKKVYG